MVREIKLLVQDELDGIEGRNEEEKGRKTDISV